MPRGGRAPRPGAAPPARLSIVVVLPAISDLASGGYKVVYTYANHLAAQGHRVTVIHAVHLSGGRVRHRGRRASLVRGWRELRRAPYLFDYQVRRGDSRPTWFDLDDRVEVRNVAFLTPRTLPRADVVVATAVTTARVVAAACHRTGATGAYLIQGYEIWMADRDVVDATWQLPLTKFVIADWLADKGAELGVETQLMPNGIDLATFPPGPPVATRAYDVVALASHIPGKRTDLLVKVLHQVAEARGGVRAVLFGTCARPEGLPEGVDFVRSPTPAHLAELYRSAKVYLCTSDGEGWHLPPAEAMSSATAVVSTEIGGVLTYARGVAATAPVGDTEALTARVVKLLDEPDHCQELASAGLERIRGYDEASAARRFEDELVRAWQREHPAGAQGRAAGRGAPPRVTAVVPAYNSAGFIGRTLDSLAAQTWPDLEILVGDDASTDDTLVVVRDFAASQPNVRVVERPSNLGWLANTNDLMSRASGELVFLAFHDDTVAPQYVERLVTALEQNPDSVLAFSDLELAHPDGTRETRVFRDLDGRRRPLVRGLALAHSPTSWWVTIHGLVRASAVRQVGGLRPNDAGEYGADWPWIMHLSLLGEFVRVPETLCTKAVRPDSVSRTWGSGPELQAAVRRVCVDEVKRSPISWWEKLVLTAEIRRRIAVPSGVKPMAKRLVRKALP